MNDVVNRLTRGQTWGICGRHGEWEGPERCPGCAAEPKQKDRGVNVMCITGVDREAGVDRT